MTDPHYLGSTLSAVSLSPGPGKPLGTKGLGFLCSFKPAPYGQSGPASHPTDLASPCPETSCLLRQCTWQHLVLPRSLSQQLASWIAINHWLTPAAAEGSQEAKALAAGGREASTPREEVRPPASPQFSQGLSAAARNITQGKLSSTPVPCAGGRKQTVTIQEPA